MKTNNTIALLIKREIRKRERIVLFLCGLVSAGVLAGLLVSAGVCLLIGWCLACFVGLECLMGVFGVCLLVLV